MQTYHMAGISVHLRDGNVSYADIDPELLGRVMGVINAEEFATILDAMVTAVELPQSRRYCQRLRKDEALILSKAVTATVLRL